MGLFRGEFWKGEELYSTYRSSTDMKIEAIR